MRGGIKVCGRVQKGGDLPFFSEKRGGWGNKKATTSVRACRGYILTMSSVV